MQVAAPAPLPGINPQRPSIESGFPVFASVNWPRNAGELGSGLKMLMRPSPKFPTSKSPAKEPNPLGAIASPHG